MCEEAGNSENVGAVEGGERAGGRGGEGEEKEGAHRSASTPLDHVPVTPGTPPPPRAATTAAAASRLAVAGPDLERAGKCGARRESRIGLAFARAARGGGADARARWSA